MQHSPGRNALVLAACTLAAVVLAPGPGSAQETRRPASSAKPAKTAETAGETFLRVYLADFDGVADKVVDLARAIPEKHYGWSPAKGVRTVEQVVHHVIGANLFLAGALGAEPPDDVPSPLGSLEGKAEHIAALEASIRHFRRVALGTGGRDLGREVELGGRGEPRGEVLLRATGHLHEHLGQLIAYARSNGVVPPWSAGPR
jgi:uncharacterized damage-inducible protein DinB